MYDELILAGKTISEIFSRVPRYVKIGEPVIEALKFIELSMQDAGFKPSFDTSITQGNVVAHGSGASGNFESGLVRIDAGVDVDGWLSDSAITIDLSGRYTDLVETTKGALEVAIAQVRDNVHTSLLSTSIEGYVAKRGYRVIANLGGHDILRNKLHGGKFIPNYQTRYGHVLRAGDVIAIEPLVSDGIGRAHQMDGGVLVETEGAHIAHFEHSILVDFDGCIVLTR